ncbi:hypothetical protein D3C81_2241210 [compost metagenome]
MQVAVGPGDVDALVDRGDVRRAGKGAHDTAGTEYGQPAQNAQARIHGLERQGFAIFDVDRHRKTAAVAQLQCQR